MGRSLCDDASQVCMSSLPKSFLNYFESYTLFIFSLASTLYKILFGSNEYSDKQSDVVFI